MAEQKQRAQADRTKQREKENAELRLAVRQVYVKGNPNLNSGIRNAILKEKLRAGMTMWDVIAAYSMWEYSNDPRAKDFRDSGVVSLWNLQNRVNPNPDQEEWFLQRGKDRKHLSFKKGLLASY